MTGIIRWNPKGKCIEQRAESGVWESVLIADTFACHRDATNENLGIRADMKFLKAWIDLWNRMQYIEYTLEFESNPANVGAKQPKYGAWLKLQGIREFDR